MVRSRKKTQASTDAGPNEAGLDVNAVVSYNLKAIRERRGWTQQSVAERLGRLTGHQLPQASISAMERGFDGERRRRFDAHELYLFSEIFGVPVLYFFVPPPTGPDDLLADTGRPVVELYKAALGEPNTLGPLDERLSQIQINNPEESDRVLAAIFGYEHAAGNWHDSFRTWRKLRIAEIEREYGDRLDEVAAFLKVFSSKIEAVGPLGYLQEMAHRPGEETPQGALGEDRSSDDFDETGGEE